MSKRTMLGRTGWFGQCGCCNEPRDKHRMKRFEERRWRAEAATEMHVTWVEFDRDGAVTYVACTCGWSSTGTLTAEQADDLEIEHARTHRTHRTHP